MNLINKFSSWYIPLICKHQYKALAFYLILALLCAIPILFKPGLKLDADLSHLLPEGTPSVKALEESYQRFGSTDQFMIAIQSDDVYLVAALQDSIREYIHKNWQGDFVSTQVDNENQFFMDNALLYLPIKHLERIRDNLEDLFYLLRGRAPISNFFQNISFSLFPPHVKTVIVAFFFGRKLHIVAVEFRQVVIIVLVTAKFAVFERIIDRFRNFFQIEDTVCFGIEEERCHSARMVCRIAANHAFHITAETLFAHNAGNGVEEPLIQKRPGIVTLRLKVRCNGKRNHQV